MIGSWAGAMGQTQFLPSNFLAYAVDADGDGRRDIWGSMADVMASTANFLARSGWQAGQPWGVEVRLPPGFDLGRADAAVRQSSAQWAAEGVRSMDGRAAAGRSPTASILLPAGARGPAFLVGPNFRAILRYNNSTSYALAVGLLSQRLAGGPGVQAPWPRDLAALTRSQLLELQTALNQRGFASRHARRHDGAGHARRRFAATSAASACPRTATRARTCCSACVGLRACGFRLQRTRRPVAAFREFSLQRGHPGRDIERCAVGLHAQPQRMQGAKEMVFPALLAHLPDAQNVESERP